MNQIYESDKENTGDNVEKMKNYYKENIKNATQEHPMFKLESKAAVISLFEMEFKDKIKADDQFVSIDYSFDFKRAKRTIMLQNIYYVMINTILMKRQLES